MHTNQKLRQHTNLQQPIISASQISLENYLGKYNDVDFTRVFRFVDVVDDYADYCSDIQVNKLYVGLETIDNCLHGIRPPEVCLIISPPNIGKTALCQRIARHNIYHNQMCKDKLLIWFSTETSQRDLLERELQRELKLTSFEVEQEFVNNRDDMTKIAKHKLKDFENLRLVIGRINIDLLSQYALAISEEAGKPIGAIIVDYAQRVRGNSRNMFENMSEVADKTGEMAIGLNVPLILTSQTSRENVRNQTIDQFSAKGSGELDNCGQIIITMQKLKDEDMQITDPVIALRKANEEIYIHQVKIEKKKRGKYLKEPLIVIQDAKTLELYEYEQYKNDLRLF